jgi:hypothetical protein
MTNLDHIFGDIEEQFLKLSIREMITLKLNKNQYVENCSTEKAYAIRFSKYDSSMVFISKEHCEFIDITNIRDGKYWNTEYKVEFPLWLYDKFTEQQKDTIKMIVKENRDKENEEREQELDRE